MKALTVWQPWASLIAAGSKPYEFRGWQPPKWIIGERIAIHAGARKVQKQEVGWLIKGLDGTLDPVQRPALVEDALAYLLAMPIASYPRSAIVCTAVVGEPVRGDEAARRLGIPAATNDSDREGTFNWGWPMLDIKNWLIWCVMAALSTSWIVLACLKAGGVIDWSWWVVLAPLFVSVALPSVSGRRKRRSA